MNRKKTIASIKSQINKILSKSTSADSLNINFVPKLDAGIVKGDKNGNNKEKLSTNEENDKNSDQMQFSNFKQTNKVAPFKQQSDAQKRQSVLDIALAQHNKNLFNQTDDIKNEEFSEIFEDNNYFKWNQFFEAFFYHLLGQILIGPLTILIALPLGQSKLVLNFGFYICKLNFSVFFFQFLLYSYNALTLFIYYSIYMKTVYFVEVFSCILLTFIRITIISVKFGVMAQKKYKIYKSRLINQKDLLSELFISSWFPQSDEAIEREIVFVLLRENIDFSNYNITFIAEPGKKLQEELENIQDFPKFTVNKQKLNQKITTNPIFAHMINNAIQDNENNFIEAKQYQQQQQEDQDQTQNKIQTQMKPKSYNIGKIINHIYKGALPHLTSIKYLTKLCLVLSLINAFLPFAFRRLEFGMFIGETILEKIVCIAIFLVQFIFFFLNFLFVLIALIETQRQAYGLSQLTLLLSPTDIEQLQHIKILPTINIFCPDSIQSWAVMHIMIRKYGEKIKLRIDNYMALIIGLYSFIFIIIILSVIKIIPIQFGNSTIALLLFQCSTIIIVTLKMIVTAIKINSFYALHIKLLKKLKDIISTFNIKRELYFGDNESELILEQTNEFFKTGVQTIKCICKYDKAQQQLSMERIVDHLDKLTQAYGDIIEDMQIKNEFDQFRVMGFEAKPQLLSQILGLLVTAGLAVANFFITKQI